MQIKRVIDAIFLLFLLGAGLLSFFLLLSGAETTGVLADFYWIKADTAGIPNANAETYWLSYRTCAKENGNFVNCSDTHPAYPFSPRDNFHTTVDIPSEFLEHRDTYYYLSKVGWAMLLVGLFFLIITIIPNFMALCFHKTFISITASVFVWFSWFFVTLAACLLTSAFVKGKHAFKDAGRSAKLGVKNFAFLWTSVFILTLCAIWNIFSTLLVKTYNARINSNNYYTPPAGAAGIDNANEDDLQYYGNTGRNQQPPLVYQDVDNTAAITRPSDYAGFTTNAADGTAATGQDYADGSAAPATSALKVPFQNKGRHSSELAGGFNDEDESSTENEPATTSSGNLQNPIKIKTFKSTKTTIPETDETNVSNVVSETVVHPN